MNMFRKEWLCIGGKANDAGSERSFSGACVEKGKCRNEKVLGTCSVLKLLDK